MGDKNYNEESSGFYNTKQLVEFSIETDKPFPTYSPRNSNSLLKDESNKNMIMEYLKTHNELNNLVKYIETQLLIDKPNDPLEYITNEIFANLEVLKNNISKN